MVAGHLQEKNNFYYIVLSYKDETGKRRTKWESTGLPVKKNKKKAGKRHKNLILLSLLARTSEELYPPSHCSRNPFRRGHSFCRLHAEMAGRHEKHDPAHDLRKLSGNGRAHYRSLFPQTQHQAGRAESHRSTGFLRQAAGAGQAKHRDPLSRKYPQSLEVCGQDRPDPLKPGR